MNDKRRFPDAYEIETPAGAEGWQELYAYHKLFQEGRRDIDGIMCHAAIVSREYNLPAVVGTGFGTHTIKSGMKIRVDGDSGRVTILEGV